MKPIIILTGPTAAGKTELSIKLAEAVGGENGFRRFHAGLQKNEHWDCTKIMPEEMDGIPHYLVDELEPDGEFHVVRFQQMCQKRAAEKIYEKGKIPIVVGGTGFYGIQLFYMI